VEVDPASGAIRRLTDRTKGREYVAPGGLMGVLELLQEAPHGMTAWEIGQIVESRTLTTGGTLIDESDPRDSLDGDSLGMVTSTRVQQNGPHRACVRTLHRIGQSRVAIEIGLASGSRSVDVRVVARWREVGTPETGVPMLRMAFATATNGGRATYEVPFGSIERPANGREVPALRWADLSDAQSGVTLVNDCKYGHSAEGSVLRVTLLRSSYDPDPLPEVGLHHMRFAIVPHDGPCSVDAAMRAAAALNQPLAVITTDFHAGPLPTSDGYVELLTPNVALAALKRSEDTDAVIVRLYETGGRDVEARVRLTRLVAPGSCAVETDLLERPLATNAARMEGDTLVVRMPAHGIVSVAVGELPA
jgi:alpha-mannosidase